MKEKKKDILVVGLALFGSYFGAGNLIFPPLLGFIAGSQWTVSSVGFIISAVLMPVLALYVISNNGGSLESMTSDIHKNFSKGLLLVIMLFAAHISVPRTGAVAYELGFKSIFPGVSIVVFILVYFSIVVYFSLDVNKMISKVGKFLTPTLVVLLLGIIIKGVFTPIGIADIPQKSGIFTSSFLEGYQTGDLLVSYLVGNVFIGDIVRRGYKTNGDRNKLIAYCGLIAIVLLAVIYIGLIYLGASLSAQLPKDVDRSVLLVTIAKKILGDGGFSIFSVAVVLACITTAIGQITSIANFFHNFSGGKINHKHAVVFFSILSGGIAILGVENIVYFATPIFLAVYPCVIVLMILGILRKYIKSKESFRYALLLTIIVSLMEATLSVVEIGFIRAFIDILPLSAYGFAWFLPATLGVLIGGIAGREKLTQFEYGI